MKTKKPTIKEIKNRLNDLKRHQFLTDERETNSRIDESRDEWVSPKIREKIVRGVMIENLNWVLGNEE